MEKSCLLPLRRAAEGSLTLSAAKVGVLFEIPASSLEEETSPFKPSGFTSSVYTVNNPPKDWCDIGLLLPHEAIRMEMAAMNASVLALKEDYDDAKDDWHVLYFSQWYIDIFSHIKHRWG